MLTIFTGLNSFNLTKITFAGSLTDVIEEGENKNILTIGGEAFTDTGLDYKNGEELVLPARISSIGSTAFNWRFYDASMRENLQNIRYMGTRERLEELGLGNTQNWTHATVKTLGE